MSVLKMLTEIVKAEDDYAKAVQPDFKKTMAGSILDFYTKMAEANASAMGPQRGKQITEAGKMAKGEMDRLSELEKGIKVDAAAWEDLLRLEGTLDAAGHNLGAVSSQSAFGSDMKKFLTTSPEQGAARLYHLSRRTGFPVDQLIDATKASLTVSGAEDPALNSALKAMSEDAIQNTLAAQKATERMNAAVRKVEGGLVGTGSYGRKGEGIIMSLLGTTGALHGGKMDQDAVATLLGYPDTNNDGKPGPIPENPSAASAREFIEKNFGGGEDEWARRTTDEWARAVQRDPAFVSYAKAAERKPGEFVRNGQVLQHRLPDIYDRMRADYRSGNLQGMGAPVRTGSSVIQERVMEPQRRRLFDRWRQQGAPEAQVPTEAAATEEAPRGGPPSRAELEILQRSADQHGNSIPLPGGGFITPQGGGEIHWPGQEESEGPGSVRPLVPHSEALAGVGEEGATPGAPTATLPPGQIANATEGWADYNYYEDGTIRFLHPDTGELITVTETSDPASYGAIMEKAFRQPGRAAGTEGAQPPAGTPAGTPAEEDWAGTPFMPGVTRGDAAAAETPAGGLPDLGTLAAPPPTASGGPAQDQGYLSGLRGEGGGFIGGPIDQDPMGKALREGAKREQGRHWLNANKASLGTDSAGFPIPPTRDHPLFQEWLTITDPEGAARRAELLAERDADEARRATEAGAREGESAVTDEQADAENLYVPGHRDEMLADQSAFEQTRDVPTEPGEEGQPPTQEAAEAANIFEYPSGPALDPAQESLGDEPRADLTGQTSSQVHQTEDETADIYERHGTPPFDAEEFHKGDPTYGEADPGEPQADLTGQSALTTQSFQRPEEVDYARPLTDEEWDEVYRDPVSGLGPDSPITVRDGVETPKLPQGTMDPEDKMAAVGGEIGSSMDPTQGGLRVGVEGGTAFEQTSIPSAPHPKGASVSAKTAANPNHDQAAHAPNSGGAAAASKAMADALRKSAKEQQKDTGVGAR
jgi:hypothetical protein